MKTIVSLSITLLALWTACPAQAGASTAGQDDRKIQIVDPPEKDFFSKVINYKGIPIKAHKDVTDEALHEAWRRLDMLFTNLPMVLSNLVAAGAECHIIGANQVTTDLPEWRHDKHVPLDEYNGQTRDQRTRGMGGIVSSFGEENLLKLPGDRYAGRDIVIHEFIHGIFGSGIQQSVRQKFLDQLKRSQEKGLWVNSYAASGSGGEYLSEVSMWYWGTRGDLSMQGAKPENGREGLKKYDPETYALVDDFYSGRIEIEKVEPRRRPNTGTNTVAATNRPTGTNAVAGRGRGSTLARALVAHLTSYKVGETKIAEFYGHAGMTGATDNGTNGWYVTQIAAVQADGGAVTPDAPVKFRVDYRNPSAAQTPPRQTAAQPATTGTNTPAAGARQGNARGGRGGRGGGRSIADLEFKAGVLTAFTWNN